MGVPTPVLRPERDLRWTDGLRPALIGWAWARICIGAGFLVAHALSGRVTLPDGRLHLDEGLLTWDGAFYRALAAGWYDGAPAESARFFPAYPALGRLLAPLFLGREDLALLAVTNACALGGAVVLWRLAVEALGGAGTIADGGAGVADPGAAVADRSAWMVAIIPSAFVLAFAYSEGPSLLLVAATLLALHRRAFAWTALWALAAAAVRPVGVLLVVPIAVEVARTLLEGGPTPPGPTARGDGPARPGAGTVLGMGAAVVAPLAGLGLAMAWLGSLTGDAGLPLRIQRQLRDGFRDPVTRLAQAVWDVTRGDFRDVYNLAFALAFIALAVVAVRRRQPLAWILYSVATLVVAGSANNIDSFGRYALLALPLVIALAQWAGPRWRQVLVAVGGSVGLVWLTAEALLGRVVP